MIALSPKTRGCIASLSASARRVSVVGSGGWTTDAAIKAARRELRDLEQTIRDIRRGLPK